MNQKRKGKKENIYLKINGESRSAALDTTGIFLDLDNNYESAIDTFVDRNKKLLMKIGLCEKNGLMTGDSPQDKEMYNLFLLGFVSNVESYFRTVIRKTILVDRDSYTASLEQTLTYAAAVHHRQELLPEALLEQSTFISLENIKKTVSTYLGINFNAQDLNVLELFNCISSFETLCQIRHCIIHRAGLLGSRNAIKLGIDGHKNLFEKFIVLDSSFMQVASIICLNAVRSFNNFLFNQLVSRYVQKNAVSWDFRSDAKWFKPYFNNFNSTILVKEITSSGGPTYECLDAYNKFRDYHNN